MRWNRLHSIYCLRQTHKQSSDARKVDVSRICSEYDMRVIERESKAAIAQRLRVYHPVAA